MASSSKEEMSAAVDNKARYVTAAPWLHVYY